MMVTKFNERLTHLVPYLAVAALASLTTSWALHTPVLSEKAQTLEVVQERVLPSLAGQLSKAKTDLKQANCDKDKMASVAIQGVVAEENPKAVDAPTWDDIVPCRQVAPVKVPVPVVNTPVRK